jgi:hypothetical protein
MMLVKYLILGILFLLCLHLIKPKYENFKEPLYAIHSVFILRENILFLEQWIDYHIQLGFNKFYLYDNSKVKKSGGCHVKKYFKPGSINKHKVNYGKIINLSDSELQKKIKLIQNKYSNVEIIEWSPKDKDGIIYFKQNDAFSHGLKKMKQESVKWCANIDMDEFIVIKEGQTIQNFIKNLDPKISAIKLGQIRFNTRFDNISKLVIDIDKSETKIFNKYHSPKHIYRINDTKKILVHSWQGIGKVIHLNQKEICFNHYKMKNLKNPRIINNINSKIRQKIYKNSKKYIKIPYQ